MKQRFRYDHVVFDLDGTLVDSAADLAAAVNHMRAGLGLPPLPAEVIKGYIGEGARRLVERALPPEYQDRIDDALALFRTYYEAHLLDQTRPYPRISEVLALLRERGVTLSVLSNKPAAMSRAILSGLGLLPHLVAVLGPELVAARKPDPAGLAHLQTLTHVPAERMLVVGDSGIDLQTACAAGVDFCGVAWGFKPRELRAGRIDRIIDSPDELLDIVSTGRRAHS